MNQNMPVAPSPGQDLLQAFGGRHFPTILADPPWRFQNRTGKMAPEHRRLSRYSTMTLDDIMVLPGVDLAAETSHLYLWVEPLRDCRRPFGLSYAAMGTSSSMA